MLGPPATVVSVRGVDVQVRGLGVAIAQAADDLLRQLGGTAVIGGVR